jgi:serine/threonine-protein kinase
VSPPVVNFELWNLAMSSSNPSADRNLLFGILALQMDFISRDNLIASLQAWVLDKARPLGQILLDQGRLTPQRLELLDALVQEHLRVHNDSPRQSLAVLSSLSSVVPALAGLGDDDLQASLPVAGPAPPLEERTDDYRTFPSRGEGPRFRILRPHARGGIGEVFVALDEELHREVALKEIQSVRADDPSSRARFLLEAEITGSLEHPGVVPVYGLGSYADGRPFYAMRFIHGDSLTEAVHRFHQARGPDRDPAARALALRQLLGRFIDVCNAVAYAHSRGVLHRDLKPGNIMLGKYGETLVVDWGLAKAVQRETRLAGATAALDEPTLRPSSGSGVEPTQMGSAVGTPAYMSPEQAAGRLDQLGPASDVYSLGATLYHLLTGQPPYRGETGEVLRQIRAGAPPSPRQVEPATPAPLDAICRKAMTPAPAGRYATALDLAADVEHWLADEPIAAYRDPPLARLGRSARRHRTLVTGLAAAALVAVVSLTAATILLSAANRREKDARALAQQHGEDAEREAARARANFQLARDAVEEYCSKVSNDPRLREKDLEELRKDLLRSAIKFHQQFIQQHGDNPALRADLGRAYQGLGELLRFTDTPTRAMEVTRQAVAVYEQLVAANPQESSYPVQLARALNTLGGILDATAQSGEARAAFYRALKALEAAPPGNRPPLAGRTFLQSCINLSFLLVHKLGAQREAIDVCRKGVVYLEGEDRTVAREPFDIGWEAQLYSTLGLGLVQAGEAKEGQHWCARALQTIEPLTSRGVPPAATHSCLSCVYSDVGRAYSTLRDPRKAVDVYRKAVDLNRRLVARHPGVSKYQEWLGIDYNSLAIVHLRMGQRREGLANYKKALEIKDKLVAQYPEAPDFKANLARTLLNLVSAVSDLDQAKAYQRRSQLLLEDLTGRYPKVAQYQDALASSYRVRAGLHVRANQAPEAIESLDRAIGVMDELVRTTDVLKYRQELGGLYLSRVELCLNLGKPGPALEAFRKAMALKPTNSLALYRCGTDLMNNGRLDEAIQALNQALAVNPNHAEAHCNLGHCLLRTGRFAEGRAALQRGHELGLRRPDWPFPSAEWVRNADHLIRLDGRLTAILEGKAQPASSSERLALALLCLQSKHLYVTSTRYFAEAFTDSPKLAENLKAAHRYNAACAAVRAGTGQGKDTSKLDDNGRAEMRYRALCWLQADLGLHASQLASKQAGTAEELRKALILWQKDPDLAAVRDRDVLDKLPDAERVAWQNLWAQVDALLERGRPGQ